MTTFAPSGPSFQSDELTPGKSETSVGPGVGKRLETVQVAGSVVGKGGSVEPLTTGDERTGVAGAPVSRRGCVAAGAGLGVALPQAAHAAVKRVRHSPAIQSQNLRILDYLPFTNENDVPLPYDSPLK